MSDDRPAFELHALANVTPLRPIKILVEGPDRSVTRTMSFLFEQRGYQAYDGTEAGALTDTGAWPDIVLLFEGPSFADTVSRAVSLIGRSETVRVVVATTRTEAPSAPRLRFVDSDAPFTILALEIERTWADLP